MKLIKKVTLGATFLLLFAAFCVTVIAWQEKATPTGGGIFFTDVTEKSGLNFKQSFGDHHMDNIVKGTGTGVCVFDYNNDGLMDVYFPNGKWTKGVNDNEGRDLRGKLSNHLFKNNGDGTFTDVTVQAGLAGKNYSLGCSAADYDNDGFVDLLVLNYGQNELFHNNGNGTFTDVADKAGLADKRFSLSGVWYDYNNDGYLDVYVANYLHYDDGKFRDFFPASGYPGPLSYYGLPNALYRNNGDGTFEDVSVSAGAHFKEKHVGRGGTGVDFNNDGRMDLVVVNVNANVVLLRNDTPGPNHWLTVTPRLKFSTGTRDAYGARVIVEANGIKMIEDMIPTRGYLSAQDPRLNFGLGKADKANLEIRWPDGKVEQFQVVKADRFVVYTHEASATKFAAARVEK